MPRPSRFDLKRGKTARLPCSQRQRDRGLTYIVPPAEQEAEVKWDSPRWLYEFAVKPRHFPMDWLLQDGQAFVAVDLTSPESRPGPSPITIDETCSRAPYQPTRRSFAPEDLLLGCCACGRRTRLLVRDGTCANLACRDKDFICNNIYLHVSCLRVVASTTCRQGCVWAWAPSKYLQPPSSLPPSARKVPLHLRAPRCQHAGS